MPPLPPSGERRHPRFAASRQPLTTVVRPCAARCCSTMSKSWRSCVNPPSSSGTSRWTHRPCGRLPKARSPLAQGSRFNAGRRAAFGLDSANGLDAGAHGSGLPSACAICRQWLRDSVSAGSRTIAGVRPSTRRAVLDTLRSSTSIARVRHHGRSRASGAGDMAGTRPVRPSERGNKRRGAQGGVALRVAPSWRNSGITGRPAALERPDGVRTGAHRWPVRLSANREVGYELPGEPVRGDPIGSVPRRQTPSATTPCLGLQPRTRRAARA